MKTLGVIGGLGPMATAYFLQLITQMTEASTDQEHFRVMLASNPAIPDRTGYILGKSKESPVDPMATEGRFLKNSGAEVIAIPCVTAHYFHNELEEKIGLPVLNAMEETGAYLKERNIKTVGLMATDGTVKTGVFQNVLKKYGISVVVPGDENQARVMDIIYGCVKAGKPVDMRSFYRVSRELKKKGAEVVLLGCTELSVIKRDVKLKSGYLDVCEVLAMKAVEACGTLREDCKELITK